MSDAKSEYGRPVEEPVATEEDVVARAHEGLADADSAGRDAVTEHRDDSPRDPVVAAPMTSTTDSSPVPEDRVEPASRTDADEQFRPSDYFETVDRDAARPAAASGYSDPPAPSPTAAYSTPDDEDSRFAMYEASARDETRAYPAAAETVAVAPVAVSAAEPVAPVTAAPQQAPVTPQPIFVQAPEAPRPRGNRGAAGAIGLLAALSFAVLYLLAYLVFGLLDGFIDNTNVGDALLAAVQSWDFWVPVVVFFIAFWLLGAIINRGRWGVWVILGLLVGVAAYCGHILGQLFGAPFWTLTAREGGELVQGELLAPLAIAAFVIGRELTIWFGAWVAARGRRVTESNVEARREYERTLEAGPQLSQL